jgi:hypothetical protein
MCAISTAIADKPLPVPGIMKYKVTVDYNSPANHWTVIVTYRRHKPIHILPIYIYIYR